MDASISGFVHSPLLLLRTRGVPPPCLRFCLSSDVCSESICGFPHSDTLMGHKGKQKIPTKNGKKVS